MTGSPEQPAVAPAAAPAQNGAQVPYVEAVHAQFERMRQDLQSALLGRIGEVEAELSQTTLGALARVQEIEAQRDQYISRVREVEAERDRYVGRLQELEAQVRDRVQAMEAMERSFGDMQGKFRTELEARDRRIHELAEGQDRWEQKLRGLVELREKVDALLE